MGLTDTGPRFLLVEIKFSHSEHEPHVCDQKESAWRRVGTLDWIWYRWPVEMKVKVKKNR